jgi:hypothetical protein
MPEERIVPADLLQQAFSSWGFTQAVSVQRFLNDPLLMLRAPLSNA